MAAGRHTRRQGLAVRAERDALYAVCASFDELNRPTVPEPDEEAHWEDVSAPTVAESWFDAVVSDYNGSTTWAAKLHGWTEHHRHGNVTYWTRPGKDPRLGHSATTNAKGTDRLIAFSSAVHHLVEPWDGTGRATSYDRFSWYAIHAQTITSASAHLNTAPGITTTSAATDCTVFYPSPGYTRG